MKTTYKMVAVIAGIAILLASCGNADARTEKSADNRAKSTKTVEKVQELNTTTFSTKVYDMNSKDMKYLGDKPAIVDFTATWCGPCQKVAPILEDLAKEYGDQIVIYKVDIDKNRELAKAFNVSSIPAILYIPMNGDPVMTVGSRDKGKFQSEIMTLLLNK